MLIRKYQTPDCKMLSELFYDTVHSINSKDYTEDQVNAWATGNINLTLWDTSFLANYTLVALDNNCIVGFGDIDKTGYLNRLYVHKEYQRRGIASALCNELEAVAQGNIITHASITARVFFEKRGYVLIKKQQVKKHGIALTNFVMEKSVPSTKKLCRMV